MARKPNAPPPPVKVNGAADPDEIEVEDVAGAEDGDGEVELESADAGAQDENEGAAALKEQLAAETRRREAAEADRDRLSAERTQDQRTLTDSRLLVIDATLDSKTKEKDAIKARIREAKEAGDYEAEVTAQDELSMLNIDIKQLNLGKAEVERRIEESKNAPPANSGDPVEDYVKGMQDGASKNWIRQHGDLIRSGRQDEIIAAHHSALGERLRPDSQEYFAFIEKRLGLGNDDDEIRRDDPPPPPPPPRRQQPPSAPVSRNGNSGGGQPTNFPGIEMTGNGKYRVNRNTPDGAAVYEAAAASGLTVAEYVAIAVKLKRGPDGQLH